jgi:hypothetical protein
MKKTLLKMCVVAALLTVAFPSFAVVDTIKVGPSSTLTFSPN